MFSNPQQLRLLAVCLALSQVTNGWSLNLREANEKEVARANDPLSDLSTVLIGTAAPTTTESTAAAASTTAKSSKATTTTTPTTSTTPKTTETTTTPTTTASSQAAPSTPQTSDASTTTTPDAASTTASNAQVTTTASTPTSSVADVTVIMTTVDGQTSSYTTTPSVSSTSGSSKSSSAATLSEADSSKSGMSTKTRNTVIGVVVGVGGTIVLCGLALVAWRIWGRKKNTDESDGLMGYRSGIHSSGAEKSGSMTGNTRNPFQSTLESYHNPSHGVNASSNF